MQDYPASLLLGVIEGITEFLPVSSTAHLRLASHLLGMSLEDGYWKMYAIVIQLGAVLCLPVYFWSRIVSFIKSFLTSPQKMKHPLALVAVAFVVTAIPSFLLAKLIGKNLEHLPAMGLALLVGGIVMGAVDLKKAKWEKAGAGAEGSPIRTWKMEDMTLKQAVIIGLCQILAAVFPGTSRSMVTIAGGQVVGLSRAAALEFSFFLSMPTMAAATGFVMLKSLLGSADHAFGGVQLEPHQWGVLALGFVVSFIVAYASVAFLMSWVRQRGFMPFAFYRMALGIFILTQIV